MDMSIFCEKGTQGHRSSSGNEGVGEGKEMISYTVANYVS
jgi:hypothetical protein